MRTGIHLRHGTSVLVCAVLCLTQLGTDARSQAGEVLSWARTWDPVPFSYGQSNSFASSVASLGDLDGDGVGDIAIGAMTDSGAYSGGGASGGAVWLVTLEPDGSTKAMSRIAYHEGGFGGDLDAGDFFGASVASLGDLDGNGITDLVIGAPGDDDGGPDRGALWVLLLGHDGGMEAFHKISALEGGFAGALDLVDGSRFGQAVASLGDLDGDGIPELAVGATSATVSEPFGSGTGSVWILFLRRDGSVRKQIEIGAGLAGFTGALDDGDVFGSAVAALGDSNGDGIPDLAVGASGDDDAGENRGAFWFLRLAADGTVASHRKLTELDFGIEPPGVTYGYGLAIGRSITVIGDVDRDGRDDLAVGSPLQILLMGDDLSVKERVAISSASGGNTAELSGVLGKSLAALGDHDGDGIPELLVGGFTHGLEFSVYGHVSVLHLNDGSVKLPRRMDFWAGDHGMALAALADTNGDGLSEIAAGAPDWNSERGRVLLLDVTSDHTVASYREIRTGENGFTGELEPGDRFGRAVADLGDLNGDGISELAVGAPGDDDGPCQFGVCNLPFNRGAVWILFPDAAGQIASFTKVNYFALEGDDPPVNARFGTALAALGDLDGDGTPDMAVNVPTSTLTAVSGSVWIVFLRPDGSVKGHRRLDASAGFSGDLDAGDRFGAALAPLGDLDGDGRPELAIGATHDDDGGQDKGAVWILSLEPDGSVHADTKLSATAGGLPATLAVGDLFGRGLCAVPDLDGDGVPELAVGVRSGNHVSPEHGAGLLLSLRADGTVKPRYSELANPGWSPPGSYDPDEGFGFAFVSPGDLDGDGLPDLMVGAPLDDAIWTLVPGPYRWTDLGHGLAGTHGVPGLVGEGELVPGRLVRWTLDGALAAAPAALVLGLGRIDTAFAGGLMLPRPDVVLTDLSVDADGRLSVSGRWPRGLPDDVQLWAQAWLADPAGVAGWAASNGVLGSAP